MPKISIITPVYNVEDYLPRCIDSIINQTFTDFECLLIDDGSTDNSGVLCDEYAGKDSRIRVFHQKNQGQAAARNYALDIAQGEYIAFIDGDDWVSPEYLNILHQNIVKANADIAVCNHVRTSEYAEESHAESANEPICWTGREFLLHCMTDAVGKHWLLWDKLFRRSCFDTIRLPIGRVHEDNATVYKLLYTSERVVDCEMPLYYYFQREGSTVHSHSWKKRCDYILLWEEMCQYFVLQKDNKMLTIAENGYFHALVNCCPRADSDAPIEVVKELKQKLVSQKKKVAKRLKVSLKNCPKYYETIYPRRMKIYWTFKGIRNKFKR